MKFCTKKSLLSEDEESAEKKINVFKGRSKEPLQLFLFEDLRPDYGCLFLGEGYWSAVTFSPDLSPLCALLLVRKMEEAGTSFPAVDSILVERAS